MNINAGHEITSKARIIHQIQLIRGITLFLKLKKKVIYNASPRFIFNKIYITLNIICPLVFLNYNSFA